MILALLGAGTGILSAHLLGPTGEGQLTAIQAWPTLLGSLATLGLESSVVYFIAREPQQGRQFAITATSVGVLSALMVGIAAWVVLPPLMSAQGPQIVSAARVFLLVGLLYAGIGIPHASLRGADEFASWNIFRLAPAFAWLLVLLASYFSGGAQAVQLSRYFLLEFAACGIPFLFVINHKLRGRATLRLQAVPEMLRFGLPSSFISLPQSINLRLDQLLIIAFLPSQSLGLYAIAVSWSNGVGAGTDCSRGGSFSACIGRKKHCKTGAVAGSSTAGGSPGSHGHLNPISMVLAPTRAATAVRTGVCSGYSIRDAARPFGSDPRVGRDRAGGSSRPRAPSRSVDVRGRRSRDNGGVAPPVPPP